MKNRRGAAKRRCQQKKTPDDPSGIGTLPTSGFLLSGPDGMPLVLAPHRDSLLSRPTETLWFIWVQPSWGPFCSRSDVSSLCWPRRTQWPHRRHTGWRFPYSGLWICLQKPALAASWQRGMVVKASGCAGQGILILAWLETRDHFNPFALRASEDFPVDVDRPT